MFPQCRFSRPIAKLVGLLVVTLSDTWQDQESAYGLGAGKISQKNQVDFEQIYICTYDINNLDFH